MIPNAEWLDNISFATQADPSLFLVCWVGEFNKLLHFERRLRSQLRRQSKSLFRPSFHYKNSVLYVLLERNLNLTLSWTNLVGTTRKKRVVWNEKFSCCSLKIFGRRKSGKSAFSVGTSKWLLLPSKWLENLLQPISTHLLSGPSVMGDFEDPAVVTTFIMLGETFEIAF